VPKPDHPAIDLDSPRSTVCHVDGFGRHCVGETESMRSVCTVGHDPYAIASRERRDRGFKVDRSGPSKHIADTRQVVETAGGSAQSSGLGETRKCLIDSLTAAKIEEIPGRPDAPHTPAHIYASLPCRQRKSSASNHWCLFGQKI